MAKEGIIGNRSTAINRSIVANVPSSGDGRSILSPQERAAVPKAAEIAMFQWDPQLICSPDLIQINDLLTSVCISMRTNNVVNYFVYNSRNKMVVLPECTTTTTANTAAATVTTTNKCVPMVQTPVVETAPTDSAPALKSLSSPTLIPAYCTCSRKSPTQEDQSPICVHIEETESQLGGTDLQVSKQKISLSHHDDHG